MPRESQFAPSVQQRSMLTTLPAPVGGLNARDALASMPPTQAVILENFFPTSSGLMVRLGWFRYYSDIPDPGHVETLIKYNGPDGNEKIFGVANGNFIDVSLGGTYNAADIVVSGLTTNRWQYVQIANQTGDYTVTVNGFDAPRKFDGTSWSLAPITADSMLYPEFDQNNLISVAQMHRRLWFVEKNSTRVWYLPVDQVEGEVKLFDCGEVFPLGGYCQACISWSVDTGNGMDDQSVFMSSKGNIAVFTGFDPDDATTFVLSGVYTIGATVGRRCACAFGSDVLILTEDGVLTLTSILSQSKMLMQPPLTDIIQHQLSALVDAFSDQFGWDLFTSARHNQLYLNIPDPEAKYQYVMNTILDSWCVFRGYDALCWENFFEEPFFGGVGYVGRAWDGAVDDPTAVPLPTTIEDRIVDTGELRITADGDTRVIAVSAPVFPVELSTQRILDTGDLRITDDGDIRIIDEGPVPPPPLGEVGQSIQTRCLQAFNYFGSPVQKSWSMGRPVFLSDGRPAVDVFFNTDFEVVENTAPLPGTLSSDLSSVWDVALWDEGIWNGGQRTWKDWHGLNGIGFSGAIFLRTSTSNPTTWLATDFQFIKGGTL